MLVEKPVARTVAELDVVADRARKAGIHVAVCHNRLYDPRFAAAADIAARGDLGLVFAVRLESPAPSYWAGTAGFDPAWRTNPRLAGGGARLDNGYHSVCLAERLAGNPIVSVRARVAAVTGIDVDDTAFVLCAHESGATSSIQVGWAMPGSGQAVNEVYGTTGSASVGHLGHPLGVYRAGGIEWEQPDLDLTDDWGFAGLFAAVLPALASGERPPAEVDRDPLLDHLDTLGLDVQAVVLTHGHVDHAGGVAHLLTALPAGVPCSSAPATATSCWTRAAPRARSPTSSARPMSHRRPSGCACGTTATSSASTG